MTATEFRATRPGKDFSGTEDETIEATITEAELRVSSDAFGTNYDAALALMVAHLLWNTSAGATMRLDGDGNQTKSRYLEEFARLRSEVVPSFLVT